MKYTLIIFALIFLEFSKCARQLFDYLGTNVDPSSTTNPNYDNFNNLLRDSQGSRFSEMNSGNSLTKSLMEQANQIIQRRKMQRENDDQARNRLLAANAQKFLEEKRKRFQRKSSPPSFPGNKPQFISPAILKRSKNSNPKPIPSKVSSFSHSHPSQSLDSPSPSIMSNYNFDEKIAKIDDENQVLTTSPSQESSKKDSFPSEISSKNVFSKISASNSVSISHNLDLSRQSLKLRFGEITLTSKELKKILKFSIELLSKCGLDVENCIIKEENEDISAENSGKNSNFEEKPELSDKESEEKLIKLLSLSNPRNDNNEIKGENGENESKIVNLDEIDEEKGLEE